MKNYKQKISSWAIAFSLIFLLSACSLFNSDSSDENNVPDKEDPTEEVVDNEDDKDKETVNQDVTTWIPRLNNVVYHYEGSGNEYASFTWNPQFNEENYYQIAKDNGGTVMLEVYEYTDDEIIRVHSQGEGYYRDNLTSIWGLDSFEESEVILKAPIAVGTTWTNGDTTYEITALDKEIEVPAGSYQTIEVTMETEQTVTKRYYAEEIGLVYEQTEIEGSLIESKLAKIETDTLETISLTVYQPDDQLMGLDKIDTELALETNEPARMALKELLSGNVEGMDHVFILPDESEINYLFLNKDNIVEADLSDEYISKMNVGAGAEQFFLQGLVNTLAAYYGVQDVLLTIDEEPYESGHISLEEGQVLSFDDSMVNE